MIRASFAGLAVLVVLFASPRRSQGDEFPDGYGTITFEKEVRTEKTFDAGNEINGVPNVTLTTDTRSWSGTIRYLPGKRRADSGIYRRHYLREQDLEGTRLCSHASRARQLGASSDTALDEADSDEKVKARLRRTGKYEESVRVWLPHMVSEGKETEVEKDLGPLWAIGDK